MVFNEATVFIALLIVSLVWLAILTLVVAKITRHYNRLTGGVSKISLTQTLETILRLQEGLKKQVSDLESLTGQMREAEMLHLQRVGIVRFNPFSDTGGSQSFTLALLDGSDNGIVMTSLYARSGNRWYIKHIRNGKGVDLELSKEEEMAIKTARPVADLRLK